MAALTEEQSLLKDQAKAWATEQAPVQTFREMRDSGVEQRYVATTWESMVEMGWTGILIPEQYGGSDLGYLTFGVVLEELGRQLTASPLFASALAGTSAVLIGADEDQKAALLPKIVDGSEILTLAIDEGAHHRPDHVSVTASEEGNDFVLNGHKNMVVEGMAVTTLVTSVRTSDASGAAEGMTLLLVPAESDGLQRSALATVDSRGYAKVSFENVRVPRESVIGEVGSGRRVLEATLDRARAGLGAEMIGTAAQAFDMTLDYLKTRKQFGRVIGSFQALGHRAAALFSSMELSRSCAENALQVIDAGGTDQEIARAASLSKARVGRFLFEMSNQLIQIHGGIGMTDEFDAGFYLKRARVLEALYGNRAYHKDRYARLLDF